LPTLSLSSSPIDVVRALLTLVVWAPPTVTERFEPMLLVWFDEIVLL
jgi:hypothetical protein